VQAIRVHSFGGPESCRVDTAPDPVPGAGDVVIDLVYAGVNFIDVYMRNGTYARSHTYETPLPMTIGMEGAGRVAAVGPGVEDCKIGDRVAFCLERGAYAERIKVPAWKVVHIPDAIAWPVATALMLQGSTAHYLSHAAFPLSAGDVCLVHAGAGGVGQLLIQLAKARGAIVLTTVGNEAKAAVARARGADHTILYRQCDFREEVLRLTDGRGVDVVYDSVGKDTIHKSIRSVRRRGLCVLFGASSGVVESIEPLELAEAGSVFFTRPHLADYMQSAAERRDRAADLFALAAAGRLEVTIDREFPLHAAREAHAYIEAGKTQGKLLLAVGG
jgi:NADPH2:quinone reductase